MPPRTAPTERQKRLGAELRKMRIGAGRSTEFTAGLLGMDRGKISNIESGVRIITPERVRTLADSYACTSHAYVEALAEMAGDRAPGWWSVFQKQLSAELLDIAEFEWHATNLRASSFVHVPGLLQTSGYARAACAAALPPLTPLDIELRVSFRMQRQQALHREAPVLYTGYIHEAALRMDFGGAKTMRGQLDHLCEVSEQTNVDVRVIPFKTGAFPGAGRGIVYASGVVPQLDTVELESTHGPVFTHEQGQLDKYRAHLDWMERVSLPPAESQEFMHRIARDL
ncbi:Scr1 family TA system antitoxin-like transcriptional regulator [Streptomyces sp. NPDC087850]|uniref:Scr1 family TA system antitoxin-like transcriptional regulator n=1 Tax=Streptomyces sp. NPDC087850 TaxID=3365809 RepID=UPI0037FEB344